MKEPIARVVRLTAWLAILLAALEAIARQLTRTRPLPLMPESAAAMALWPLAGLAVLLLIDRRTRPIAAAQSRARLASIFAGLFAIGLCFQLHLGARLQSDG